MDGREESRLSTQRPGQASQLTWRGIGSERQRMPWRSCCKVSQLTWRGMARRDQGCPEGAAAHRPGAGRGPGEEAGRPRLQGESSEAPRELVFQRGEHEGSSELGGGNSSRTRHHADVHRSEDRHTEAVEAERPRTHGASSEAPREQALQGGEREGWPGSCRRAQHQVNCHVERAQRCPRRGGCPQAANDRARQSGGQPSV